mmetsp:Transcript_67719/g.198199  ORF Transcript_67719/g.198199 Transcript_67719/m.198199 type:complete len:231 (+) Transcript_67719:329-1021(+)
MRGTRLKDTPASGPYADCKYDCPRPARGQRLPGLAPPAARGPRALRARGAAAGHLRGCPQLPRYVLDWGDAHREGWHLEVRSGPMRCALQRRRHRKEVTRHFGTLASSDWARVPRDAAGHLAPRPGTPCTWRAAGLLHVRAESGGMRGGGGLRTLAAGRCSGDRGDPRAGPPPRAWPHRLARAGDARPRDGAGASGRGLDVRRLGGGGRGGENERSTEALHVSSNCALNS